MLGDELALLEEAACWRIVCWHMRTSSEIYMRAQETALGWVVKLVVKVEDNLLFLQLLSHNIVSSRGSVWKHYPSSPLVAYLNEFFKETISFWMMFAFDNYLYNPQPVSDRKKLDVLPSSRRLNKEDERQY